MLILFWITTRTSLHPLVLKNTSVFSVQCCSTVFNLYYQSVTWWHDVSQSYRIKDKATDEVLRSSVFCGRVELLLVWTLTFLTLKIFTCTRMYMTP